MDLGPGNVTVSGTLGPVELDSAEHERLADYIPVRPAGPLILVCGHPGHAIERVCEACGQQLRQQIMDGMVIQRMREANPMIFAPELIEQARGEQLSATELALVRAQPSVALRKAGLGAVLQ